MSSYDTSPPSAEPEQIADDERVFNARLHVEIIYNLAASNRVGLADLERIRWHALQAHVLLKAALRLQGDTPGIREGGE